MGTKKKYSDKVFCKKCAQQRQGRLAFLMEVPVEKPEEGKPDVELKAVFLNVRAFYRIAKESPKLVLPKNLFFTCDSCKDKTFLNLNKARKLELAKYD